MELIQEMEEKEIDVLGRSETKRKGTVWNRKGWLLQWCGVNEKEGKKTGEEVVITQNNIKEL